MSTFRLALRQASYDNKAFWRNPAAAFFTFVFPLMFLVLFHAAFGNENFEVPGGEVSASTFYVPSIIALSVINACYASISQFIAFARDEGRLKRLRGTPMPPLAFLAGRILQSVGVAGLMVVLILALGALFYDVEPPTDNLPAVIVTLIVGAATFCALGLAVSAFIPNADAAPAVVNASILPLMFISNVYIPAENMPDWLRTFASAFPIVHFANALHDAFSPFDRNAGLDAGDFAVMAAWLAAGLVIAIRYFKWEPRR
jgi:ABC-2 type transport system permease protein